MINVLMSSTTPLQKDGITSVMLNLFNHIDKTNYKIDFIAINEPEEQITNEIVKGGGTIKVISRDIRRPLRFINDYASICKKYDVVHVHGNSATMTLEMIAAWLAGVKVRIAHSHNTYCTSKIIDKLCRPIFYALCNRRVACGEEAGKWLFKKRSFSVINNGIDTEKYSFDTTMRKSVRDRLRWNESIIVGNVANFLYAKNHDYIIDVFYELQKTDNAYRLLLLGTGELIDNIIEKVKRLRIDDKVCFIGSVSNVEDYLSAMDIVLMPSLKEGFPLTLVEEQSNGLCCVVSNTITQKTNITGNVYFLPLNISPYKWAKYIEDLLNVKHNRQLMCIEAIDSIKKNGYDIKDSVKKLERIYSESIKLD